MQLKINIANLLKRASGMPRSRAVRHLPSALHQGARRLANVSDKDPCLLAREEDIRAGDAWQLEEHPQQHKGRSCRTS